MNETGTASLRHDVAPQPVRLAAELSTASAMLRLLRPRQWVKNALVLAPLVFAGRAGDASAASAALGAALLFTLASALAYVLNDVADRDADARHPVKRGSRPLAAGWIGARHAALLGTGLAGTLAVGLAAMPVVAVPIGAFLIVNAAYSIGLKRVVAVEMACVASGYGLRAYAGALAIGVPISGWMLATTSALSLFLVASKRFAEQRSSGAAGRAVLDRYSPAMLRATASTAAVAAGAAFAAYALVVNPVLTVTVPVVVFALARYDHLLRRRGSGESPEDLLWADLPLLGAVLVWAGCCVLLVG